MQNESLLNLLPAGNVIVIYIKTKYLVPNLLVLRPTNTERINFPKLAAFTASNLLA